MTAAVLVGALPPRLCPEQTFEHWRLATASIFEARPLDDRFRCTFRGDLKTYYLERFLIGTSHSSPLSTRREEALVGAVGVDHVLFQLYVSGEGRFEAEGREGVVRAGDLVCFDLSRRHRATLSDLHALSVVVPRSLIQLPPRTLDAAHGATLSGTTRLGRLLARQLTGINAAVPDLTESELAPAASLVSTIVGIALSHAGPDELEDRTLPVALSLQAVRAFIDENLADPAMSPGSITRRLGLSRSALYRVFEPLGGISNYIRDRRLDRAALHLVSAGTGRGCVARLAFAVGFANEATFSRAFRSRFGTSPREAIRNAQQRSRGVGSKPVADEHNWIQGWLESLSASRA